MARQVERELGPVAGVDSGRADGRVERPVEELAAIVNDEAAVFRRVAEWARGVFVEERFDAAGDDRRRRDPVSLLRSFCSCRQRESRESRCNAGSGEKASAGPAWIAIHAKGSPVPARLLSAAVNR